jgi:hypothetical protein
MAAPDIACAPRRLAALARLLLAAALLAPAAARAQGAPETRYTRLPEIRIPFARETGGRIRVVQLFVARDRGRDWQHVLNANPADGYFPPYVAPDDGTYLFAVRAIDLQGQYLPPLLEQLTPQLRIILDRKPPVISLKQVPDRRPEYPNVVTVEWDVRDENLDLRRFALEYRVPGHDWQREASAAAKPMGMQSWMLQPGERMEVRLRAGDLAGNEEVATTWVGLTADGRPLDPPPGAAAGSGAGGGQREPYYVNSLQVSLPYKLAKMPDSGLSVFELWYTRNKGQTWTKAPKSEGAPTPGSLPASPGAPVTEALAGTLVFTADGPGEYGFVIVARNGVGIGPADPKPGDLPQYRVVVDTEPPKVRVTAEHGQGYEVRNVRVQWSADDPHLADKPVKLEYAEVKGTAQPAESDWKPIEGHEGPQDRSGLFTWTIGSKGPFRFYVRAKAADKAGNVGGDQKGPVVVDLEQPTVIIEGIGPAGGAAGKLPER